MTVFSEMVLLMMVGNASWHRIPPPFPASPLMMVKPSRIEQALSPFWNFTTESEKPPSMVVTAAPSVLRTMMALPRKSMFST